MTCYNFRSSSHIITIFSCVVHIFRCVNLLQFPFELTHHCIVSCVVHIAFFLVLTIHTCIYIYIYIFLFDIIYISPLWFNIYYDTCNMNAKVNVKPWRTCSINTECTAMSPETHTIQTTHFHRMMHWDTRSTQYILTIRQCFPLSKTHEVYRLSIGGELSSTRVRPDSDTTVCNTVWKLH